MVDAIMPIAGSLGAAIRQMGPLVFVALFLLVATPCRPR